MAAPEFKRAVLGLNLHTLDPDVIDFTAGLAERLGLSLVGLLALDNSLPELAAYPGLREFLPAVGEWRAIDPDRIAQEQMLAAQNAERLFTKLVETLSVPSTFEIVSGGAAQPLASMSGSDIVVVAEPRRASASVTHSYSLFLDAAVRSPASVLLIPRSVQRRKGPVVVIAARPNDPSIGVASAIAAAIQLSSRPSSRQRAPGGAARQPERRLGQRKELAETVGYCPTCVICRHGWEAATRASSSSHTQISAPPPTIWARSSPTPGAYPSSSLNHRSARQKRRRWRNLLSPASGAATSTRAPLALSCSSGFINSDCSKPCVAMMRIRDLSILSMAGS